MASGKQSPRQKMINLMYLVFIAMLALNVSKEVLTAFGIMNEKLATANETTELRNDAAMAGLEAKVNEQPAKYAPLKEKADQIEALSQNLTDYIGNLKKDLTADVENPRDYENMDRSDQLDNRFFKGGKIADKGKEFTNAINTYREGVLNILGNSYPQVSAEIKKRFDTQPVKDREGIKKPWLDYNYQGFPLVASITKLTQVQSDVQTTENDILSTMLSGQLNSEVSLTNYQAIVIPDKTAFFNSENFKGKVVLGRFDKTLKFNKVIINGKTIDQSNTVGGQVILDFPAGNVGEKEITGELQYTENDSVKSIPIKTSYAVIPKPNSAVISADKMNVVYRGVKNPMTISIPGVGNVSASAPGLSSAGGAGNYMMDVTTLQAREVNIKVSGKLPGGETVSDSKMFRVKDIPRPVGTIRGEDGSVKMQRNGLEISSVGADLPDFDFDIKLNVTGFSFHVQGQPTVKVHGNKLDGAAKNALRRAGRGETVQIFDIEAQLSTNSGYKLKKISPVFIELTN